MMTPYRVFIFGSCVTRDAFEVVSNNYKLSGYIARSSFGSAFSETPFPKTIDAIDAKHQITSKWQRGMVRLDAIKGAKDAILRVASETDIMLVDFIDERFDLFRLQGGLATGSAAFARVFADPQAKRIRSGSEDHYALWRAGFQRFLALVAEKNIPVIVNAVRVSAKSQDENLFEEALVIRQNLQLSRLYEEAESLGYCKMFYNPATALCDPEHKWGPAPFHYTRPYYESFMDSLDKMTATQRGTPRT